MVNWIDCAAVKTRIIKTIKADFQKVVKSHPGVRDPKLSIILFAESPQAKRFVMRKADTVTKAGFLTEINVYPKQKNLGSIS